MRYRGQGLDLSLIACPSIGITITSFREENNEREFSRIAISIKNGTVVTFNHKQLFFFFLKLQSSHHCLIILLLLYVYIYIVAGLQLILVHIRKNCYYKHTSLKICCMVAYELG